MNAMKRRLFLSAIAMTLPLGAASASPPAPTSAAGATHKPVANAAKHHLAATPRLDLNEATKDQLLKLSGMTEGVADAIISGRPYTSRDQLLEKKVVDPKTFHKIHRYLTVKPTGK